MAAVRRPGNAGANTAADHFEVPAAGLRAVARGRPSPRDPRASRHQRRTHAFTQDCRDAGIRFSVDYGVDERAREAILALPDSAWEQAIDAEGKEREGAQVAELTDRLDLSTWPEGARLIVRRERPHPGAQFCVFRRPRLPPHRLHHRPRRQRYRRRPGAAPPSPCQRRELDPLAKENGMRNMPSAVFEHNQAWLEISRIAQIMLRWSALLCLEGELPSPSQSGFASASCTSAGGPSARPDAPPCGCPAPGPGRGSGGRICAAAGAAGRLEPIATGRSRPRPPSSHLPVSILPVKRPG